MTSKRQFVDKITKARRDCDSFNAKTLYNAVKKLAHDIYDKKSHFIFELIQNAEDNAYREEIKPTLLFSLKENNEAVELIIENNETGFIEENVKALCDVGESTKSKHQGYIGEKGIGFKSVFQITSCPKIFSNGFKFSLPEKDEKCDLGYIVPNWIANISENNKYDWTTIVLPINKSNDYNVQTVIKDLQDIEPEIILFLEKLQSMEIGVSIHDENYEILIEKNISKKPLIELTYIKKQDDLEDAGKSVSFWLTSKEINKPEYITGEKREDVKSRKVSIAIPINSKELSSKLFAYLPVWDNTDLPFMINADFLLTSSRTGIKTDERWNHWLRDYIADVYKEAFLSSLKSDKLDMEQKYSVYASVPLDSCKDFLVPVVEQIHDKLKNSACILTTPDCNLEKLNLNLEKPEKTRKADKAFYDLFMNDTEPPDYLINTVKLVCPEINKKKYEQQLKAIGVEKIGPSDLFECLKETEWLNDHSLEWFTTLYKFLSSKTQKYSILFNTKDTDTTLPDDSILHDYSINKLSIVPTKTDNIDSFELKGTYEQPIYFSCDDESAKKLKAADKWLSQIMHMVFLDPKFLEFIENGKQEDANSIKNFMQEQLDIHDFDLNNCCNDILQKLKQTYKTLEADVLIKTTEFLFENADDDFPWNELPVLLADGRTMLIKDIRKLTWNNGTEEEMHQTIQAVVVPENFDPESGWQYIWKEEEDRKHFIALADGYKMFPEIWFDACNIKRYPGFAKITFTSEKSFKSIFEKLGIVFNNERKLFDLCMSYSAIKWISEVKVASFGMPISLITSLHKGVNKLQAANALMAFLKTFSFKKHSFYSDIDEKFYENSIKAKGTYKCNGKKTHYDDNTILYYLKKLKWMPSKQGFVPPNNVFLPTEEIKNIFGDNVAYITPGIHQDILELLGVCLKPTVKKILETLKKDSSGNLPVNFEKISHIYDYLKNVTHIKNHGGYSYDDNDTVNNIRDVRKAFQEHPLIFIPDGIESGTWHNKNDCVWKDSSDIFGNDFVCLEKYYPDFKDFFLETLETNESVSIKNMVAFLKSYSENKPVDIEKIKKIYSRLDSSLDTSNIQDRRLIQNKFSTHSLIFIPNDTESGTWHNKNDCVWRDASDVLGNDVVYLEKYYPDSQNFFLETLEIKEEADEKFFADSWLQLQNRPVKNKKELHVTITALYKKLREIAEADEDDHPDWWDGFLKEVKFYTQSDTFEKPGKILIPDDGGLKKIFKNSNVDFVWRPEKDSFNEWMPFYKAFSIPLLSEFAIPSYEDEGNIQPPCTDSKNKHITKQSVLMIATWLREKRNNDYNRLLEEGTFDKLVSIQEATTDSNIMVSYRLVVNDIQENQEAEFPVYWDTNQEKNILIYNPKNSEKIEIDISNVMAKELLDYKNYKDCADWIELTLKAKNTKRLKSKGWSVPREIENKYSDQTKAYTKPQNQEQNQFDIPDEYNVNVIENENYQIDRPININQPIQPSNSKLLLPNNDSAVQKDSKGSPLTPTTTIEPNEVDKSLTQNRNPEILVTDKMESQKSQIDNIEGSISDDSDSTHSTDNFESQKTNKIDGSMPEDSDSKSSNIEPTDKPTDRPELKKDFKTLLNDSFNRPGITEFDKNEDDYYSNNKVKNSVRRSSKLREGHKQNITNEPTPEQRRRTVEREILEKLDPKVKQTLYQWYHGKCQICGNTWPKINGEPYFDATYLVVRQHAAYMDTPANAVCLCAEHFAQWRFAAKETPDIVEQIKELRLPSEGGKDELSIVFKLLGKDCKIKYCEKHLLDLKELINAQTEISLSENLN